MHSRDLRGIRWLTIDYARDELLVATDDGRVAVQAGQVPRPDGPLDFESVTFRPDDLTLKMVVPSGEKLEVEVFADDDQLQRRSGRPIVYLDQNKWAQVAQATHRPEKVPPKELEPTLRITELARSRRVLLPISSAHWIEMGSLDGRHRAHLASMMVGLSRGWVMRDPLRVASAEMARLFENEPVRTEDAADAVFTLEARALFAEPPPRYVSRDPGLRQDLAELIDALSGVQSILAVLLEDERNRDPKGVEMARRWAEVHQSLAAQLASRRLSDQDRRRETLGAFIRDLGHGLIDVAQAHGFGSADFKTWVNERADRDLRQLPYLGRRREVTHARLSNAADKLAPSRLDRHALPTVCRGVWGLRCLREEDSSLLAAHRSGQTGNGHSRHVVRRPRFRSGANRLSSA